MQGMIFDPTTAEWQYGEIPKVETVAYDALIVFCSDEGYIGYLRPWGDKLNYLKWDGHWSQCNTGWWTWIRKGSEQRPDYIKTKEAYFKELDD